MHIVDLSQTMRDGLTTYRDLPAIHVCDFLSRENSKSHYSDHTSFQIDEICMVGNSGTYIDSPFHRYAEGKDLSELSLSKTVMLPGIVIRTPYFQKWHAIEKSTLLGRELAGKAVLFDTGWCKFFGTSSYFDGHPFLTEDAADYLHHAGVALVGIDSHNIDDTRGGTRPVHTILLGAEIPIVEHLSNLNALPDMGFRFSAAPIKFAGIGTFPTRAFAVLD